MHLTSVSLGPVVSVTVTPIVTAANAYGTNYVIGGLLIFPNVFGPSGSGLIQEVVATFTKVETISFTFVPFSANPASTTWTDAAVAAINAADAHKVREPIALSNYSGLGTHTVAAASALAQGMAVSSADLYGVLIGSAALTNNFTTAGDVTVTVKTLPDR